MKRFLWLLVLLASCVQPLPEASNSPTSSAKVSPCHAKAGRYYMYRTGEVPTDPSMQSKLCPTEEFVGVSTKYVIFLDSKDPWYYCGEHRTAPASDTLLVVNVTTDKIKGYVFTRPLTGIGKERASCYYYMRITLEWFADE